MSLTEEVDRRRRAAARALQPRRQAELGQFFTPGALAGFMASFFEQLEGRIRLLDAGAGVGMLVAAVVAEACRRSRRPRSIEVDAFEIDPALAVHLEWTLGRCRRAGAGAGVDVRARVNRRDFLSACSALAPRFTHAILNPPYKKLGASSEAKRRLAAIGVDATNLYAAFAALGLRLLQPGGELVAITPRSFCNGPYFRPFRELLLREAALVRVHVFESRSAAFADDEVLQENIVFHVVKARPQGVVVLSTSRGPDDAPSARTVPFARVVRPDDAERFIRLAPSAAGDRLAEEFADLPACLDDLGLFVSTGRVVDFRAKAFLRHRPTPKSRPLIYPAHFADGVVRWPRAGKKPNALADVPATADLWMPSGSYAVVKRFSSKEERRRVVAALFDPTIVQADKIGFENHLNVFHAHGRGIDRALARGLVAFLNSTPLDDYFRQYSGHTQVNATDLRNLRYPSLAALRALGRRPREAVDDAVRRELRRTSLQDS